MLKNDGYCIVFTLRGVGSTVLQAHHFPEAYRPKDGSPRFGSKAKANVACFSLVHQLRRGHGPLAETFRVERKSTRHTFSANGIRPRVPGGRAFELRAGQETWGSIVVEQNFKEVSE